MTTKTEKLIELNELLTDAIVLRSFANHWNKPMAEVLTNKINKIRNEIKNQTPEGGQSIRHTGNRIRQIESGC